MIHRSVIPQHSPFLFKKSKPSNRAADVVSGSNLHRVEVAAQSSAVFVDFLLSKWLSGASGDYELPGLQVQILRSGTSDVEAEQTSMAHASTSWPALGRTSHWPSPRQLLGRPDVARATFNAGLPSSDLAGFTQICRQLRDLHPPM
jgi:hypothetical protein